MNANHANRIHKSVWLTNSQIVEFFVWCNVKAENVSETFSNVTLHSVDSILKEKYND